MLLRYRKTPCCHSLKHQYVQGHKEEVGLLTALGSDTLSQLYRTFSAPSPGSAPRNRGGNFICSHCQGRDGFERAPRMQTCQRVGLPVGTKSEGFHGSSESGNAAVSETACSAISHQHTHMNLVFPTDQWACIRQILQKGRFAIPDLVLWFICLFLVSVLQPIFLSVFVMCHQMSNQVCLVLFSLCYKQGFVFYFALKQWKNTNRDLV